VCRLSRRRQRRYSTSAWRARGAVGSVDRCRHAWQVVDISPARGGKDNARRMPSFNVITAQGADGHAHNARAYCPSRAHSARMRVAYHRPPPCCCGRSHCHYGASLAPAVMFATLSIASHVAAHHAAPAHARRSPHVPRFMPATTKRLYASANRLPTVPYLRIYDMVVSATAPNLCCKGV